MGPKRRRPRDPRSAPVTCTRSARSTRCPRSSGRPATKDGSMSIEVFRGPDQEQYAARSKRSSGGQCPRDPREVSSDRFRVAEDWRIRSLVGDVEAVCEARRVAQLIARTKTPVYLYSFEREVPQSAATSGDPRARPRTSCSATTTRRRRLTCSMPTTSRCRCDQRLLVTFCGDGQSQQRRRFQVAPVHFSGGRGASRGEAPCPGRAAARRQAPSRGTVQLLGALLLPVAPGSRAGRQVRSKSEVSGRAMPSSSEPRSPCSWDASV